MPVRCASGGARKPSLTVEALEDRWLPSAVESWPGPFPLSLAVQRLVAGEPALVTADMPGLPGVTGQSGEGLSKVAGLVTAIQASPLGALINDVATHLTVSTRGLSQAARPPVDARGRPDPDWRADVREQLIRHEEISGSRSLLAVRNTIISFEEAALSQLGTAKERTDTRQLPNIELPRTALTATDSRGDWPRETEVQVLPMSGRNTALPGGAGGRWLVGSTSGLPHGAELKLIRLSGVLTSAAEAEPPSSSAEPVVAGLLDDILPCDLVALEQGIQHWLQEVSQVSQWVAAEVAAAPPGSWFLATLVGGAIAAEMLWHRQRTLAGQGSGEDSDAYWRFPSALTELTPYPEP
jgi:hypothetical protein